MVAQGGSPEKSLAQQNSRPGEGRREPCLEGLSVRVDKSAPSGAIVCFDFVSRGFHPELPTPAPSGAGLAVECLVGFTAVNNDLIECCGFRPTVARNLADDHP